MAGLKAHMPDLKTWLGWGHPFCKASVDLNGHFVGNSCFAGILAGVSKPLALFEPHGFFFAVSRSGCGQPLCDTLSLDFGHAHVTQKEKQQFTN